MVIANAGSTTPSIAEASTGQREGVVTALEVERPRDIDVARVARPPRRDDRDVVESVGPPCGLAASDLDLHAGSILLVSPRPAGHLFPVRPERAMGSPRIRRNQAHVAEKLQRAAWSD